MTLNNQDTYINLHSLALQGIDSLAVPYVAYATVLFLPLVAVCLFFHCVCFCARRCTDNSFCPWNRLIAKERIYLYEYSTTVVKDMPKSKRPRPPLITHVLNLFFAVENCWLLLAWLVLNVYAALGISFYSSRVHFWGLGVAMGVSLLSTVLVVTHLFRARKIRSIGNNSNRILKQLLRRNLVRMADATGSVEAETNDMDTDTDDGLCNAADDLEQEINQEMAAEDIVELMKDVSNMEALDTDSSMSGEPGTGISDRRKRRHERSFVHTLHEVPMKAAVSAVETNPLGNLTVNALEFYLRSVSYGIKKNIVPYIATLLFCMLMVALAYVGLFGICICDIPVEVSTTLTRTMTGRSCNAGEICYTYLNLAEDPSTQMIVKFRTADRPITIDGRQASQLNYGTSENLDQSVTCHVLDFGQYTVDSFFEPHFIHTCELTQLSPNTTYYFKPAITVPGSKDADNVTVISVEKPLLFHTFHASSSAHDVKFISGGDMGLSESAIKVLDVAVQQDPHFIAIIGDLDYANAQGTCYRRSDAWLSHYSQRARSPTTGAMIPMLTALGNHEAEWGRFGSQPWQAKPYLAHFLHKIGVIKDGDSLFARNDVAYHAHSFSNHTMLIVLDSGVITPHGAQLSFIKETLEKSNARNKIAAYHAPLYPGSRSPETSTARRGREMWESAFHDGGIKAALENHDHVFKVSKRLGRNGEEASAGESGIYYLGDGAMGTKGTPAKDRPYADTIKFANHVWLVESGTSGIVFTALDHEGTVLEILHVE